MTTAWVFPGQGAQSVGMGRAVCAASPAARALFDQAHAVLGFDIAALCFDGPADALTRTENAQPALLLVEAALLVARGWGAAGAGELVDEEPLVAPAFVAGHSLGEYAALWAAGALSFATALQLVRRRGELMAAATEGTMAAVLGLDATALTEVCAEASVLGPVVIANENAPGQVVISGATAAVARAGELAKARGAKRIMPLQVSAAFHSPLMQAAADGLAVALAAATMHNARIPVISNVTALPLTEASAIRRELVAQITAPVRWVASVEYLADHGVTAITEWGPGNVLTGLCKRIAPGLALRNVAG